MSADCVQLVRSRFFLNHHGWTLKVKSERVLPGFLHWQLFCRREEIFALAAGSCQKGINQNAFNGFRIFLPPVEVQRELCGRLDELQKQAEDLAAQAEEFRNDAKFMLDAYLGSSEESAVVPSEVKPVADLETPSEDLQEADTATLPEDS